MFKRNWKKIALAAGASLVTLSAQAADYADVAAAVDAVELLPTVVSPVFLAFVTLAVGALTIRMVVRLAKKGMSVA